MAMRFPEKLRHPTKHDSPAGGLFRFKKGQVIFQCVAAIGEGWEHVSVSLSVKRCPDWEEMCMIKEIFWEPEDCVVQFHPPASEYVNNHPHVLHLWRKINENFETPPSIMVGLKGITSEQIRP